MLKLLHLSVNGNGYLQCMVRQMASYQWLIGGGMSTIWHFYKNNVMLVEVELIIKCIPLFESQESFSCTKDKNQ